MFWGNKIIFNQFHGQFQSLHSTFLFGRISLLILHSPHLRSVVMRNGYGDVDSGLSVLLVYVEKKEIERETNFLQVMIKSLHELHSKEKSKPFRLVAAG